MMQVKNQEEYIKVKSSQKEREKKNKGMVMWILLESKFSTVCKD